MAERRQLPALQRRELRRPSTPDAPAAPAQPGLIMRGVTHTTKKVINTTILGGTLFGASALGYHAIFGEEGLTDAQQAALAEKPLLQLEIQLRAEARKQGKEPPVLIADNSSVPPLLYDVTNSKVYSSVVEDKVARPVEFRAWVNGDGKLVSSYNGMWDMRYYDLTVDDTGKLTRKKTNGETPEHEYDDYGTTKFNADVATLLEKYPAKIKEGKSKYAAYEAEYEALDTEAQKAYQEYTPELKTLIKEFANALRDSNSHNEANACVGKQFYALKKMVESGELSEQLMFKLEKHPQFEAFLEAAEIPSEKYMTLAQRQKMDLREKLGELQERGEKAGLNEIGAGKKSPLDNIIDKFANNKTGALMAGGGIILASLCGASGWIAKKMKLPSGLGLIGGLAVGGLLCALPFMGKEKVMGWTNSFSDMGLDLFDEPEKPSPDAPSEEGPDPLTSAGKVDEKTPRTASLNMEKMGKETRTSTVAPGTNVYAPVPTPGISVTSAVALT